jgi:hypothetical protein
MKRTAATILELLVVLAVLATLVAILLPTLSGARRSARDARVLADLRSHGQVFSMYCADYADVLPYFVDPLAQATVLTLGSGQVVHIRRYFSTAYMWNYALADQYYAGSEHHDSFYPPRYPAGLVGESARMGPAAYQYGCAFVAHPDYWDPYRRLADRSQLRPTRVTDVHFPDRKVLLAEWYTVLVAMPEPIYKRSGWSQAVSRTDGSARHVQLPSLTDGYWRADGDPQLGIHLFDTLPWGMHTLRGVRGRDIH